MSGVEKIERYTRQWKQMEWLAIACKTLALAVFLAAASWFLSLNQSICYLVFFVTVAAGGFFFYQRSRLKQVNPEGVVRLFNQQYPALEYSSQLILQQPDNLPVPARLQWKKIANQLNIQKLQAPPVRLTDAFLWLLLSLLLSSLLVYFAGAFQQEYQPEEVASQAAGNPADTVYTETLHEQIPELKEGGLQVAPPAYTRQKAYYTQLASLRAPERSRLTWQLEFSRKPERLWLVLSNGDSIAFSSTSGGKFTAQLVLAKSILYQLVWQDAEDRTTATDYLRLEAVPDEPPLLQIEQPEQYVRTDEPVPITFRARTTDDYGLTDAYLQLTISQGSGENVSFREEKLWFEADFSSKPQKMELSQILNPTSLGMVPGDELYFYLVAFDNRTPKAQRSRSETWFYHWLDTANQSAFEMGGMAMDIMPDYFRSQRQIIIDTEKLIKERSELPEEEFEQRSSNLGVDQKLLRLRYGKFLGEEFESGYGEGVPESEEEHGEHEGHEEEEHEEGRTAEGALPGEVDHDHEVQAHEEPVSPSAATLLREFMHAHDTEEGATFYEESIKVKLKAALAEMWESELRLRTLRPQEALPFQYRALEIIKDVQQATRIYVERIGFEPPALKPAEKRLTGELENVGSVSRTHSEQPADSLEAIKKLLPLLQEEQQAGREEARLAGQELALIVQTVPRPAYLRALKGIGKLAKGASLPVAEQLFLIRVLYSLLPEAGTEIRKRSGVRTALETEFMRKVGGEDE